MKKNSYKNHFLNHSKNHSIKTRAFAAFMVTAVGLGGCGRTADSPGPSVINLTDGANTSAEQTADSPPPSVTNLTDGANIGVCIDYSIKSYDPVKTFSYDFFAQNTDAQNPVLSPVSAYLALGMAGFGAEGTTQAEFQKLLGEDLMVMSDHLMNILPKSSENTTLSLANSAWFDDQFLAEDEWLGEIKSLVDAEAFQADLTSTQAMDSMNRWIEEHTNGMISDMVEEPFQKDTRLVLFDTIYFKAKWVSPFEPRLNQDETFTLENGKTFQTEMMRGSFMSAYLSNDKLEGVILPYRSRETEDGNFAFIALKAKEPDQKIREVCDGLTDEVMAGLLADKQTRLVNIKLPKFEITFDRILNQSLMNMGLTQAFDPALADFSSMGSTRSGQNLFISLVRQKAKIIVDEEGTEAAAATEIEARDSGTMITEEPVDLFFNVPFLYMIMDMDREIPLFIGILDSPALVW